MPCEHVPGLRFPQKNCFGLRFFKTAQLLVAPGTTALSVGGKIRGQNPLARPCLCEDISVGDKGEQEKTGSQETKARQPKEHSPRKQEIRYSRNSRYSGTSGVFCPMGTHLLNFFGNIAHPVPREPAPLRWQPRQAPWESRPPAPPPVHVPAAMLWPENLMDCAVLSVKYGG